MRCGGGGRERGSMLLPSTDNVGIDNYMLLDFPGLPCFAIVAEKKKESRSIRTLHVPASYLAACHCELTKHAHDSGLRNSRFLFSSILQYLFLVEQNFRGIWREGFTRERLMPLLSENVSP